MVFQLSYSQFDCVFYENRSPKMYWYEKGPEANASKMIRWARLSLYIYIFLLVFYMVQIYLHWEMLYKCVASANVLNLCAHVKVQHSLEILLFPE